jgi:hypothetical protein
VTEWTAEWIELTIMLGAGVFGGVVNYYLAKPDEVPRPDLRRSVVVGIAASFLVPLFLNMISSDLMDQIRNGDASKAFVLVGFCLIAAISSAAFIRTLSDRVLDQAKKAAAAAERATAAVEQVDRAVRQVDKQVELIEESGSLPGSMKGLALASTADAIKEDAWNTDPNKGQFGGASQANGRQLEATITPAAGRGSAACNVLLRVHSTESARPLKGEVTFHLHPTFGRGSVYSVPVKEGKAEDSITSWGRFTVGALADEGKTKLELDLADVPGGTKKFYAQ